jgi:hypothetical protein
LFWVFCFSLWFWVLPVLAEIFLERNDGVLMLWDHDGLVGAWRAEQTLDHLNRREERRGLLGPEVHLVMDVLDEVVLVQSLAIRALRAADSLLELQIEILEHLLLKKLGAVVCESLLDLRERIALRLERGKKALALQSLLLLLLLVLHALEPARVLARLLARSRDGRSSRRARKIILVLLLIRARASRLLIRGCEGVVLELLLGLLDQQEKALLVVGAALDALLQPIDSRVKWAIA